jgi:hypothetical protein
MIRREDFTQPTVDPEPQDVSGVCVYLLIFHLAEIDILKTIRPKSSFKVRVSG